MIVVEKKNTHTHIHTHVDWVPYTFALHKFLKCLTISLIK